MAKKKGSTKKKMTLRGRILAVFGLVTALLLMPTTVILFFGMLPTTVIAFFDRSGRGTRTFTIGAMNFSGCTPFILDLWAKGHVMDNAWIIITDPRTIIVIYSAAGIGYLIDWAMSGIVKTVLVQRSTLRLAEIAKRQEKLVERWGKEVTGDLPLDAYGFPVATGSPDQVQEEPENV